MKGALYLIIAQLINYAAPLLAIPIITRSVGVPLYGEYVIILSTLGICLIITEYGQSITATNKFAIATTPEDKVKVIGEQIGAKIILFFGALLLSMLIMNIYFDSITKLTAIYLCIIIVMQGLSMHWVLIADGKQKELLKTNVISKITYVTLVFITINATSTISDLLMPTVVGSTVMAAATASYYLKQIAKIRIFNLLNGWHVLRDDFSIFKARLLITMTSTSPSMVLGINSVEMAAVYGAAEQLYKAGQGLLSAVTQSTIATISKTNSEVYFKKIFNTYGALVIISVIFSMIFSKEIITIIFGEEFVLTIPVLQTLLIALAISYMSAMRGYPYAAITKNNKIVNKSIYYGSAIFIILTAFLYLTHELTPIFMAFIIIASESVIGLHRFIYNRKS